MRSLKQFALAYVPGMQKLRDIRNNIRSIIILSAKIEKIAKTMLPLSTAHLLEQLAPWESASLPLLRVGKEADGGYIMGEDFEGVAAAYSFGIGDDVSWDRAIAERGIPVYMYDNTIEGLPEQHPHFHFFKTGIGGKSNPPALKDIGTLIQENGHQGQNLLMKMDIEGAEYAAFAALSEAEIAQFTQIVMEVHRAQEALYDLERYLALSHLLQKILKDFYCVHLHANNNGWMEERNGIKVPVLLELSFIRKDRANDFQPAQQLRTDLDRKNFPHKPDLAVDFLWKQI